MIRYAIHQKHPNLSITLTLYTLAHDTTRRLFYLRNLSGESQAAHLDHAQQIMSGVAAELHYLTGFGLDKGVIKVGDKKALEVPYPALQMRHKSYTFRDAVLFRFSHINYYVWVKDKARRWRSTADQIDDSWQVEILTRLPKKVSFRLPCITIPEWRRHEYQPDEATFFGRYRPSGRRRRKSGYLLAYDRNDPTFTRFCGRFLPDGNLSFGERRYFTLDLAYLEIVGGDWPQSKANPKKEKGPRKSALVSQPVDNTNYVYLIRMGRTKSYKIGISNDPHSRLTALQSANPYKLKLLHTFPADNATAAEEALHAALHPQRMQGEWFKLSDAQRDALTTIAEFKNKQFVVNNEALEAQALLDA